MTTTVRVQVTSFHPGSLGGGVLIGRDVDGSNGSLVRARIAAAVLPRAPVEGEFWRVTGAVERHPVEDLRSGQTEMLDHVAAAWAGPIAPKGDAIRRWIARHPGIKGVGDGYAERLWDAHGPKLYDMLRQRDVGALARSSTFRKPVPLWKPSGCYYDEITALEDLDGLGLDGARPMLRSGCSERMPAAFSARIRTG